MKVADVGRCYGCCYGAAHVVVVVIKFVAIAIIIGTAIATATGKNVSKSTTISNLDDTNDDVDQSQVVWSRKRNRLRGLFDTRIIGGTAASQGEFPFFVQWAGCGATLIHEDVLLTAAHCWIVSYDIVLVGPYLDSSTQGGAQWRQIIERKIHPQFNNNTMNYDYMVMKLNTPVTGITPVTLNSNSNYPATGSNQQLTVIGFGVTTPNGPLSSTLQKVNVNYVDPQSCNTDYDGELSASLMLCAGAPNGGKDSCQGDSGGPILDANKKQVGIVSFGNGCGKKGYPGVYSRVSGGIDWINQQICLLSDNPPARCRQPTTPTAPPPASSLVTVQISIMYDGYPQEDSWILSTSSGKFVYYSPSTVGMPNALSSISLNLPPGGYILKLMDNFGDGFCCSSGNGYYAVYALVNNNNGASKIQLAKGFAKFQFQLDVPFTVPTKGSPRAPVKTPARTPVRTPPVRTPVRTPPVRTPVRRPTVRPVVVVTKPTNSISCKDSTTVSFTINGQKRNCAWLSIRPSLFPSQCVNGKAAYTYCRRTCKRC